MLYTNLKFPKISGRPFFYTNFVQTVDGKVAVKKPGYWPIGSKLDHDVLIELRSHADVLIHGGNLAREFGEITLKNLHPKLSYYIITSHSNGLPDKLKNHPQVTIFSGSLKKLVQKLKSNGQKLILVEGGPTLLGSFLKENLMDEIFLTVAPKIYGTSNLTLNLVEGILFPKNSTKKLRLLSVKPIKDELFLRYKVGN